jgi:anaphase-promoting complex subunit 4
LKRLAKSIDTAGRELLGLIAQHLQPAAEMIAFRIGELQGLSRWRARVHRVGLHETLMERAMEHAGMLLVQVECLLRTISDTAGEFRLFFVWLTKSLRQLSNDVVPSSNQLPVINRFPLTFLPA